MKDQLKLTYYIYKLQCFDPLRDDACYIGSTANLRTRKNKHKSNCNNSSTRDHNNKVYQIIRENGGWENWQLTPIEELPMHTKVQASIREQHWIGLNNCRLNSINAYTDQVLYNKQYYLDHKQAHNERAIAYYYDNKATLQSRTDCPCGGQYQHRSKSIHSTSAIHKRYLAGVNQVD